MNLILHLFAISTLSIILSTAFFIIRKRFKSSKLSEISWQIIIGIGFGIVAILATEYGYDYQGATINARDAAPLCAGLFFGGPAGIIAGLIGGTWRWIATSWGAGIYAQAACTISTVLAGFTAAFLRKFMFDNKSPNWIFSFLIAAVMEVLHLSILFVTHLSDPGTAFEIVKLCTFPMIFCNGVAVMLSSIIISLLSSRGMKSDKRYQKLSQLIQTPMLIAVSLAFFVSCLMIYNVQTGSMDTQTKDLMLVNLGSVKADILGESDSNMLELAHMVAEDLEENPDADIYSLAYEYDLDVLYIIDDKGIVVKSLDPDVIGYDMNSDSNLPERDRQSSKFMVLLEDDCNEYVQECVPMAIDKELVQKLAGVSLSYGGFVQIGYDVESFHDEIRNHIKILSANRNIGEKGYVIITEDNGSIISYNDKYDGEPLSKYGVDIAGINNNELVQKTIKDTSVFVMVTESEGFKLVGIIPADEVYSTRNNMIFIYAYLQILIFAMLFIIIYVIIKRVIVDNIRSVNKSLGKIIGGNLDTTVDVHASEEFASLSNDINSTVETLKHYIDEAASRIDKELAFARSIQHSALPSVFPAFPGRKDFDVYATMNAAKEVGGDFYDFYFVDENKFAILMADVSGKGIPAAMFMMTAKSIIKGFAETQIPVNEVFSSANKRLCEGNDADMFVTGWMGIIDLNTGHVTFANAGHNPPIIYRKGQGAEYLKSKAGFVLAGMPGLKYKLQELDLNPGDRIYLYTDGVTEATAKDNSMYGEDRLIQFIENNASLSAEDMLHGIKKDIDDFAGDAEQFDDITMLMFDFKVNDIIEFKENVFDAEVANLGGAMEFIETEMEAADVPMKTMTQISIAFEEMFVNISKYAYPDSDGKVKIGISTADNAVTIQFADSGVPFNPLKKDEPDISLSAEERKIGGLGIFMVTKTMDDVNYEYINDQNVFTMRKEF